MQHVCKHKATLASLKYCHIFKLVYKQQNYCLRSLLLWEITVKLPLAKHRELCVNSNTVEATRNACNNLHGSCSAGSSPTSSRFPAAGKLLTSCVYARGRERLLPEKGRQGASVSKGSQLVCIWCCQTAVLVSSLIINTANGERPRRARTAQLHAWCIRSRNSWPYSQHIQTYLLY